MRDYLHPDDAPPSSPARAERERRRFRPRVTHRVDDRMRGWAKTPTGRLVPRLEWRWEQTLSIGALARLALIRLCCECGWEGGYADMERRHHRCPECKREHSLSRVDERPRSPPRVAIELYRVVRRTA